VAGVVPTRDEIDGTVARMEARLDALPAGNIKALMESYRRVCVRFANELADARDIALCRSAALMLVQELARPHPGRPQGGAA
jgi:hypothetical protein